MSAVADLESRATKTGSSRSAWVTEEHSGGKVYRQAQTLGQWGLRGRDRQSLAWEVGGWAQSRSAREVCT